MIKNIYKMLVNYNFKLLKGKIALGVLLYTIIIFLNSRFFIAEYSAMDVLVDFTGGYNKNNSFLSSISILVVYLYIAFLVEYYLEQVLNKQKIYILARIKNYGIFILSNYLLIILTCIFMTFMYDILLLLFNIFAQNKYYVSRYALKQFNDVVFFYSQGQMLIRLIIIQLIGILGISSMHFFIKSIFNSYYGFVITVILYVINLTVLYLPIGGFIASYNYPIIGDIPGTHSLSIFILMNGIMVSINIIYILFLFKNRRVSKC